MGVFLTQLQDHQPNFQLHEQWKTVTSSPSSDINLESFVSLFLLLWKFQKVMTSIEWVFSRVFRMCRKRSELVLECTCVELLDRWSWIRIISASDVPLITQLSLESDWWKWLSRPLSSLPHLIQSISLFTWLEFIGRVFDESQFFILIFQSVKVWCKWLIKSASLLSLYLDRERDKIFQHYWPDVTREENKVPL